MAVPRFLDLPRRSAKPRAAGLTHVIDKGLPLSELAPHLAMSGAFIDLWKFGWGTAYIDPALDTKLAALRERDVRACTGGTLLEVAWSQDKVTEFVTWARQARFPCIEVSRGAVPMPLDEKRDLIRLASDVFCVYSEVGAKDPGAESSPEQWADEVRGDLDAGASWVILEGRESGTVGLYRPDGSVRADMVDAVAGSADLRARWCSRRPGRISRRGSSTGSGARSTWPTWRWPKPSGWRRCGSGCGATPSA